MILKGANRWISRKDVMGPENATLEQNIDGRRLRATLNLLMIQGLMILRFLSIFHDRDVMFIKAMPAGAMKLIMLHTTNLTSLNCCLLLKMSPPNKLPYMIYSHCQHSQAMTKYKQNLFKIYNQTPIIGISE